jgi:ACS family D-galactonate transporter-like MFS transporter
MALFWNVLSLSGLGLATANNLALCRLTLIPKPAVGVNTGLQQVASAWPAWSRRSCRAGCCTWAAATRLPMYVIFAFLLLGAVTTLFVLRREMGAEGARRRAI